MSKRRRWFDCACLPLSPAGGIYRASGAALRNINLTLRDSSIQFDLRTHEIATAIMFRTTRALQAMQPTRAMFMQQSPKLYMRQTARMMAPVPVSCPQQRCQRC
jgi:hypothetical protein